MMTAVEASELLGAEGWLLLDHFKIPMRIHDVKDGGWGRTLVLVRPLAGEGEAWIDLNRFNGSCPRK